MSQFSICGASEFIVLAAYEAVTHWHSIASKYIKMTADVFPPVRKLVWVPDYTNSISEVKYLPLATKFRYRKILFS